MSSSLPVVRWMVCWLFIVGLSMATPAAAPACGGNACYPVLIGPVLKSIAKDFCSYYLKLPRTTTVTTKTTTTVTNGYTLPAQTSSVTATTQDTVSTTVTATATAAGPIVTDTATETVTVNAMRKRDPAPLFTPPKGAGDGYKPPLLNPFAPAVISAACSCLVTPTTTTVTVTSTATATDRQTFTPATVIKTVATFTNKVTVTQTAITTVTANPSTTTITIATTATAAEPAQTCNGNPGTPQRGLTGFLKPVATQYSPRQLTPSGVKTAQDCYNICKNYVPPVRNPPAAAVRSYTFNPTQTRPQSDIPGFCACYTSQVCAFFENDPTGDTQGGDVSLPFYILIDSKI